MFYNLMPGCAPTKHVFMIGLSYCPSEHSLCRLTRILSYFTFLMPVSFITGIFLSNESCHKKNNKVTWADCNQRGHPLSVTVH